MTAQPTRDPTPFDPPLTREEQRANAATHSCFSNDIPGDRDLAPRAIKDSNGDIALGMCRRCGAGEIQIEEYPCQPDAIGEFSIGGPLWPGTSKLIEEMGELGQVLGKLIGSHGASAHYDGSNLLHRLHEEIGDLKGAIDFFVERNGLDFNAINARAAAKRNLFDQWHKEGK